MTCAIEVMSVILDTYINALTSSSGRSWKSCKHAKVMEKISRELNAAFRFLENAEDSMIASVLNIITKNKDQNV